MSTNPNDPRFAHLLRKIYELDDMSDHAYEDSERYRAMSKQYGGSEEAHYRSMMRDCLAQRDEYDKQSSALADQLYAMGYRGLTSRPASWRR